MNDQWHLMVDAIGGAFSQLRQPDQWWQFGVLALSATLAWILAREIRRFFAGIGSSAAGSRYQTITTLSKRVAFAFLLGLIALVAAGIMQRLGLPHAVASVVAILALALAGTRLLINGLKFIATPGPLLVAAEHLIVWVVWVLVALYLLGWLEPAGAALDSIKIPLGTGTFSLLDSIQALVTLIVFLVAGAYFGTLATRGIMSSPHMTIGVRVGISKFVRFFVLLIAGLLGLHAVGIDLAALALFGGALGIGLGFGLQRIAANFVSGFILVADRSIRQGDVITIGDRFGVVKELRARYIVVRDRDGVDTLVPNENVVSSDVVNWSYGDPTIRLKLPVQISYKDNPRKALQLLLDAAARHQRVLKDPAPASRVMSFADNGIALELRFWIRDPEHGVNNVRSDLHLEIWDLFEQAGITIPFPQRDLHLTEGWPPRLEKETPAGQ